MLKELTKFAKEDANIRALLLQGSRANPNARPDLFQDYDIACLVESVAPYRRDKRFLDRFGPRMIMQEPEAMGDPPPVGDGRYAFLLQLMDGRRIDLTFYPLERRAVVLQDSLTRVLLDKDGLVGELPPPTERAYFPEVPTNKEFADCCNEFWWVTPYVAKALWRRELIGAQQHLEAVLRPQLMQVLTWYFGIQTRFQRSPGKAKKNLKSELPSAWWGLLEKTYADAELGHIWEALFTMGTLFRQGAVKVARHFRYSYPKEEDRNVSAFLRRIRELPVDATSF